MSHELERRRIIMNFSTPPAAEDLHAVAVSVLDGFPDDLAQFIEDMDLFVEEFAGRETLDEMEVENEYDLLALYRAAPERIPGVTDKTQHETHRLSLYRRPILDLWCDTGEDLVALVRNVVIGEVAQANGFSDEEIEAMCAAAAEASMI